MQALRAEIPIQVQGDLTVRAAAQVMPRLRQLALDGFVAVELSVDNDSCAAIVAGDRLLTGLEVDDAQPRMTQGDAPVIGHPIALRVRSAMLEAIGCTMQRCLRQRTFGRK